MALCNILGPAGDIVTIFIEEMDLDFHVGRFRPLGHKIHIIINDRI